MGTSIGAAPDPSVAARRRHFPARIPAAARDEFFLTAARALL